MKKPLFAGIAAVSLGIAIPANAQVLVGADSGGAGVRVGPFGLGVAPITGAGLATIETMVRA